MYKWDVNATKLTKKNIDNCLVIVIGFIESVCIYKLIDKSAKFN